LINARRRAAHRGPGTPRLVQRKTISSIVQGHDTQTRLLREIADVLRCPIGTVMSRLHRGRKALERELWDCALRRGLIKGEKP